MKIKVQIIVIFLLLVSVPSYAWQNTSKEKNSNATIKSVKSGRWHYVDTLESYSKYMEAHKWARDNGYIKRMVDKRTGKPITARQSVWKCEISFVDKWKGTVTPYWVEQSYDINVEGREGGPGEVVGDNLEYQRNYAYLRTALFRIELNRRLGVKVIDNDSFAMQYWILNDYCYLVKYRN